MKLTPKDTARLLALRRQAEDPGNWHSDPGSTLPHALGEGRLQEILRGAGEAQPDGTRLLRLSRDEVRRVATAYGHPLEQHLSYGVLVLFEVVVYPSEGTKPAVLGRRASFSRANEHGARERLPERYVRSAAAKLGLSDKMKVSQNPASGVWHCKDRFDTPDTDEVGSPIFLRAAASLDSLCPVGRDLIQQIRALPPAVTAAFSSIDTLALDGAGGLGHYKFLPGWEDHEAAPMIRLTEQWLNHGPTCSVCGQNRGNP